LINNRQAGRRNNRGRNNGRPNNGNNNRGGGDNGNRIDNRARGNAPQLLEKYRNMARDAQLAGDRVNAEYYLQFADHYFRVIADNRSRQEDQQARYRRNDESLDMVDSDGEGSYDSAGQQDAGQQDSGSPDYGDSADGGESERPRDDGNRRERQYNDRQSGDRQNAGRQNNDRQNNSDRQYGDSDQNHGNRQRQPRRPREEYQDRAPGSESANGINADDASVSQSPEGRSVEREVPRARRAPRARAPREDVADSEGLDLAVLPPAISRGDDADGAPLASGDDVAAPAPRKRTRRPKAEAAEAAE
jgi:Domain of unknown function (DUF4167)